MRLKPIMVTLKVTSLIYLKPYTHTQISNQYQIINYKFIYNIIIFNINL